MANLKVPSLQHLSRNWRPTPERVQRTLVKLVKHSPTFSYDPLSSAARDLILFKQPYNEVAEGIRRAIKRPGVRDNFLSVLPLIDSHFRNEAPSYVQAVATRFYPVGRDLLVPFTPPLVYGSGGRLKFPWFSYWRSNPLAGKTLSLFVTVVDEVRRQDPDLEDADFQILDFSVPKGGKRRELVVINACDVPRLSEPEMREMLAIFADGFLRAKAELASGGSGPGKREGKKREAPPPDHLDLFDQ